MSDGLQGIFSIGSGSIPLEAFVSENQTDKHQVAGHRNSQLQTSLFNELELPLTPSDLGYRGPTACAAAGITYRQLDYWARTGLVVPTIQGAQGSGSHRLYGFRDILILRIVKRLIDTGVSLPNIRIAAEHLNKSEARHLSALTIMSDGASVFECTSEDEVIDLVRGGQGVFGIAIGSVWKEVEGNLANLPGEQLVDGAEHMPSTDELAERRAARAAV